MFLNGAGRFLTVAIPEGGIGPSPPASAGPSTFQLMHGLWRRLRAGDVPLPE
jgi:hypothetical protein